MCCYCRSYCSKNYSRRQIQPEILGPLSFRIKIVFLNLLILASYHGADISIYGAKVKSFNCPLRPPASLQLPPLVIGHRGASYYLPEHTLAGYRLALDIGADYIEPDLVLTKDEQLIAVHSMDLNITTNVAQIFPNRYRKNIDHVGITMSGYFAQDFTLEEIKTLRVRQRVEDTDARARYYDGMFAIPTLDEIIDLLGNWTFNVQPLLERRTNFTSRPGLYVELKNSDWIAEDIVARRKGENDDHSEGDDVNSNFTTRWMVEDILLRTISSNPLSQKLFFDDKRCMTLKFNEYTVPPLVMQSFSSESLLYLREQFQSDNATYHNVTPPSVLLVPRNFCLQPEFWLSISELKLDGIGPDKACLLDEVAGDEVGRGGRDFMETALEHELVIHPWTERLEVEFVNTRFDTSQDELKYLFCNLRIDGMFAENIATAKQVAAQGCYDENEGGMSKGTTGTKGSSLFGNNNYGTPTNGGAKLLSVLLIGSVIGAIVTYGVRSCSSRARRESSNRMVQVASDEDQADTSVSMSEGEENEII